MVLNIAHRGARSLAPENTLSAAKKALEAGADLWETDVGVSSDGVLILMHDDSLVRTTDAAVVFPERSPWTFTTFSFAELRNLDAGSWFQQTDPFGQIAAGTVSPKDLASYHNEPIPTLEEALRFTRDANWRVNIELKNLPPPMQDFPVVERVLGLIETLNIDPQQLVLSSFNHDWLHKIENLRPDIAVQAVIGFSPVRPLDWGDLKFKTYNARHTLLKAQTVTELTAKGVRLNVWTVNARKDIDRFLAAGVSGIFTDFPQNLAPILDTHAAKT
jgi:glycerophosphoryl diester phosphodiesterase